MRNAPLFTPVAATVEKLLLTARDAAFVLSISERKLWELTNRGIIKCVRLGRSVRYARSALEAFIEGQSA